MRPLVSVIVLFDRAEFEPCLSSLLCQAGVEFEIIAVVPGEWGEEAGVEGALTISSTGEKAWDQRLRPLVVEDRNPARRRNLAAKEARGKYLAFIDDDAFAPPEWLERGVAFLESHPVYAGVGGPNLRPEDSTGPELLTDMVLTTPLMGAGSRAYRGGGKLSASKPGELHLVNFLVRRDSFESIGGFNEELGYGGEDTEFLHLASRKGLVFVFAPDLYVFHKRRPFGIAYLGQRFRLRLQSGRLFSVHPGVYSRSASFWIALAGPLALLALLAYIIAERDLFALGLIVAAYVIASVSLAAFSRKPRGTHVLISPAALFAHHLVNLAGFWTGIVRSALNSRDRQRVRQRV